MKCVNFAVIVIIYLAFFQVRKAFVVVWSTYFCSTPLTNTCHHIRSNEYNIYTRHGEEHHARRRKKEGAQTYWFHLTIQIMWCYPTPWIFIIIAPSKLHQPGIEPGSVPWQGTILPLDHWCLMSLVMKLYYIIVCRYLINVFPFFLNPIHSINKNWLWVSRAPYKMMQLFHKFLDKINVSWVFI